MSAILLRNDMDFRVKGFQDSRTGDYLNAASTKTWEIRTAANGGGSQVASGTLDYVADSNGEYVGGPNDDVALDEGTEYFVHIVLIQDDVRLDIDRPVVAERRLGRSPIA